MEEYLRLLLGRGLVRITKASVGNGICTEGCAPLLSERSCLGKGTGDEGVGPIRVVGTLLRSSKVAIRRLRGLRRLVSGGHTRLRDEWSWA